MKYALRKIPRQALSMSGRGLDGDSSSVDEAISILKNLGLTPIQAKVYVHLSLEGEHSARSIVESLRIDRVDVYRALQILQSMGFVEVNLGNPNRYTASPHSIALRLLLEKKEEELETIRKRALRFDGLLSYRSKNTNFPELQEGISDQFYKLKRGYAVVDTILEIERNAQQQVRKVVNRIGLGYHILFGLSEVERKLVSRGVKIRLISDKRSGSLRAYSKIAQMRYAGDLTKSLRFIVVDDKSIILSLAPNVTDERDSVALLTNNSTLIEALSSFFDRSWASLKRG